MNWVDFVKATIQSFREQFEKVVPSTKKQQILKTIYNETLLEPCQVEVSDLGEHRGVIWLITHDRRRKDMEVIVIENIKYPENYAEKYFKAKRHLLKYGSHLLEAEYFRGWRLGRSDSTLHLYADDFYWSPENLRSMTPYRHASDLIEMLDLFLQDATYDLYHKELEKGAEALKSDVALVQEDDLRARLEKTSRKIEQTIQQIKRIEEHERRLGSMEKEITGVRRLMGTKTFGEWKVLLSEIDKVSARVDSLSEIKEAYDKILAQQADVIKQQSSFLKWVKYSVILVPIAVALVPIIETLIRHFINSS